MLQQEGNDTNCFVSLIVDTPGKYVAAVTRKIQKTTEVTTKSLGTSYEFFGDGEIKTEEDPMSESTQVVENEVIEYFTLKVTREEVDNPLDYLDARFVEIEKRKKESSQSLLDLLPKNRTPYYSSYLEVENTTEKYKNYNLREEKETTDWLESKKNEKNKQLSFWEDYKEEEKVKELKENKEVFAIEDYIPNPVAVHRMVCQLFACSLNLNTDKLNLKQWTSLHMLNVYKKLFPDALESDDLHSSFSEWRDFIVEFLVTNYVEDCMPDEIMYNLDYRYAVVALAMKDEIESLEIKNVFIDSYCEALDNYIEEGYLLEDEMIHGKQH